jgi:hypothetical protein
VWHFAPGAVVHASDGYHHYSRPVRVEISDISDFEGAPVTVEVYLTAWVCPLDASPGPTKIGLDIRSGDGGVDLSVSAARRIAEVLLEFSDRISDSAVG